MNLNFLCCIGAEQKHDQSGLLKMNQVYFYRAYADETMSEILKDNFFNHSESHLKENDIILAYSPNEEDLPKVRWLRIVTPHAGLVKTEQVDNSYLLEVLRNDLGDLGDQVAEIEAKIPGSASVINQLATQNDVTNKTTELSNSISSVDSSAVHKTGNETIGGQKTLTSGTIWKKEDWDATQNPTSNKFATWSLVNDKNNTMLSYVETSYLTDGTIQQTIGARKEINGTKHTASLSLRIDSSGNKTFALSDNPPSSSNGAQVATTYWANAKFLPLDGGTITGVITTKNQIMFENASSAGHRGFLYKVSDGGLAMGIQNSNNSGWQSYQSFFTNGQYLITVSDGTNSKQLSAKPDGTLTWDGKHIVRLVAEQKATSSNNHTWYRKYSDGWVEQGGRLNITSTNRTIQFPVAMANKDDYDLQLTVTSAVRYACVEHDTDRETTGFKVATADDNTVNNDGVVDWRVCGYAAS